MEKKYYSLKKDILTLKTPCGPISFQIENQELLKQAHHIGDLVTTELNAVNDKLASGSGTTNHYATLLLAALNLAEKYIRIEAQCQVLHQEIKVLQKKEEARLHREAFRESQSVAIKLDRPVETVNTENPSTALASSHPENFIQEAQPDKDEPILLTEIINEDESRGLEERSPVSSKSDAPYAESISPDTLDGTATIDTADTVNTTDTVDAVPVEPSSSTDLPLSASSMETMPDKLPDPSIGEISKDDLFETGGAEAEAISENQNGIPKNEIPQNEVSQNEIPQNEISQNEISQNPISQSDSQSEADIIETETPMMDPPSFIIHTPGNRYNAELMPAPPQEAGVYQLPHLTFLQRQRRQTEVDQHGIRRDAELLEKKLGHFGIKGEVMGVSPGPVITTFEYKPDPGIKISKIVNLADDLALALSAFSIRIVAPIPGKDVMGIEIPNLEKSLVPFIDIVTADDFINSDSKVPICLGKDIVGNPVVVQLEKMPHLLIAGATGTGKSVGLNAMITSILYKSSPDDVKFLMIDPKRIELSFYNDIPHLLTPVITDMKKANTALQWMVREMDRRYNLLARFQVRNIEQFNQKIIEAPEPEYDEDGEILSPLPFIVVIIDELADLMMTASRDIELSLTRLAQMARAAGIHLILATQRPSVDVLTGIIKANFPTRISFQVSSKTDSRTIIDANGAETLLGNGDMLFVPPGTARLTRVHGTYLSEDELSKITAFIKSQRKPNYIFDVLTEQEPDEAMTDPMDDEYDEKYTEALEFVVATRQASISGIQRALRVGYNRAARIIDIMEKKGIVGPSDGIKPRKVLTNGRDGM